MNMYCYSKAINWTCNNNLTLKAIRGSKWTTFNLITYGKTWKKNTSHWEDQNLNLHVENVKAVKKESNGTRRLCIFPCENKNEKVRTSCYPQFSSWWGSLSNRVQLHWALLMLSSLYMSINLLMFVKYILSLLYNCCTYWRFYAWYRCRCFLVKKLHFR